jgi:AcrR family transcriptional regulator
LVSQMNSEFVRGERPRNQTSVFTKVRVFDRLFIDFDNTFNTSTPATMSKKQAIKKTTVRLFAAQGFDPTTTVKIAREAGATEPMIYYHFKGNVEQFAGILRNAFSEYFTRLDRLNQDDGSHFQEIRCLIDMHFDFMDEPPAETVLIISACPAKFRAPDMIHRFM